MGKTQGVFQNLAFNVVQIILDLGGAHLEVGQAADDLVLAGAFQFYGCAAAAKWVGGDLQIAYVNGVVAGEGDGAL